MKSSKNVQFNKDFKKFEKKLINFCKDHNCLNPCYIAKLLKNSSSNKRCCDIYKYIQENKLEKEFQQQLEKKIIEEDLFEKADLLQLFYTAARKKIQKVKDKGNIQIDYFKGCSHEGICKQGQCSCLKEWGNCEKYCTCSNYCKKKIYKCKCMPGQCTEVNGCKCVKNKRDCDPDVCLNCKCDVDLKLLRNFNKDKIYNLPYCPNTQMTYFIKPRLLIGVSTVCEGLGCYAGQYFKKGDFVGEYFGEILTYDEMTLREPIYDKIGVQYLFDLTDQKIIDSYAYGNKTRYINHGISQILNVAAENRFIKGQIRVGFFATKNIQIGEELFFDYGNNFKTEWKNEFNKNIKIYFSKIKKQKLFNEKSKKIDLFNDQQKLEEYYQ